MSAIKLIVASQFDATGLKKASKEFGKLGKSLKSTLGAVGLAVGLSAVTNALKQSTKAAVQDVKSQGLLAQQLKNTVGATDPAIAATERFVQALELSRSVADDDLRPALALLVRATGDVGKAQDLLTLSTDVAAGTGKELGAVSIAIAKAANGQTTALKKLGIIVKDGIDPILSLKSAFKGAGEAAANLDPFQRLTVIFGRIQEQVGIALIPTLQQFANFLASPEGQGKIKEFVDAITSALKELIGFIDFVRTNFDVLSKLAILIAGVSAAVGVLNFVLNANPIVAVLTGLGLLAGGYLALKSAADQATSSTERYNSTAGGKAYLKQRFGITSSATQIKQGFSEVGSSFGGSKYKIKEAAALAQAEKALASQFSSITGTATGGAKGLSAAQKKIQDDAKKAAEALAKEVEALNNFREEMISVADGFGSLTKIEKDLGQFEQSVADTFDGINQKLAENAGKTFATKGLDALKSFLKAEQNILETNARQRDEIVKKRGLAESLISDVKSALLGVGDLAGLLETETQSVTKSFTQIIDGFAVTTKTVVEEIIGGKGVIGRLKEVVAKTKAFAVQLTDLKRAGLNPDLFKQIVDAGPDVGGQLATEILSGGTDSVSALNSVFEELKAVTGNVAEQTAVLMFNGGVEVAGGLVAGLLSQEAQLVAAAQTLADAFNAAYQAQIQGLQLPSSGATDIAEGTQAQRLGDIKLLGEKAGASAQDVANSKIAARLINTDRFTAFGAQSVVNITMNNGIVTSTAAGRELKALENKYLKSSTR